MAAPTPEVIADNIANIPNLTDDELIFHQKCSTSSNYAKQLKPYHTAILAERKKRGKIQQIDEVVPLDEQGPTTITITTGEPDKDTWA